MDNRVLLENHAKMQFSRKAVPFQPIRNYANGITTNVSKRHAKLLLIVMLLSYNVNPISKSVLLNPLEDVLQRVLA